MARHVAFLSRLFLVWSAINGIVAIAVFAFAVAAASLALSSGTERPGTEVAAGLGSRLFGRLRRAPSVLASACDVIPSAPNREAEMLVGTRQIEDAVREAAA